MSSTLPVVSRLRGLECRRRRPDLGPGGPAPSVERSRTEENDGRLVPFETFPGPLPSAPSLKRLLSTVRSRRCPSAPGPGSGSTGGGPDEVEDVLARDGINRTFSLAICEGTITKAATRPGPSPSLLLLVCTMSVEDRRRRDGTRRSLGRPGRDGTGVRLVFFVWVWVSPVLPSLPRVKIPSSSDRSNRVPCPPSVGRGSAGHVASVVPDTSKCARRTGWWGLTVVSSEPVVCLPLRHTPPLDPPRGLPPARAGPGGSGRWDRRPGRGVSEGFGVDEVRKRRG